MQRNYVSKRGIAYADRGDGPAVLLIHAFGLDADMWRPQEEVLVPSGFRCLVPDLRGFGESAGPSEEFAFQTIVDDMIGLLDAAAVDRFVAVGVSMGAATSTALALQDERIVGLLIADNSLADGPQRGISAAERVRRLGLEGLADVYEPILFGPSYRQQNPHAIGAWRKRLVGRSEDELATIVRAYHARPHLGGELERVQVPTAVVFGELDRAIPPDRRDDYLAIPGAVSKEIAGVGHISNLEGPDGFNAILLGLLREVYPE